jgi:hypothetical protein
MLKVIFARSTIGTALAIVIDAAVIRGVVVPRSSALPVSSTGGRRGAEVAGCPDRLARSAAVGSLSRDTGNELSWESIVLAGDQQISATVFARVGSAAAQINTSP